jgi:FlaA1/EpsC-like NDP-sugar epimerase
MKNVLQSRGAAFAHDMTMTPLAWLVAYWLRFNLGAIPEPYFTQAWVGLLVIIPLQALVLWYFGLYRGVWRFASMPDLMRILKAVAVGVVLSMTMLFVVTRLHGVPRSVPLLFALLLVVMLSGPRFVYRWVKDHRFQYRPGQRVLIVGAGRAGEMLVRDLLRDPKHVYEPVAFVDDDRAKWGREVHGVRVAGGGEALPRLVADYAIDLIMLAVPSARGADMRRLVEASEATGLPFRTVPSLGDLTSGQVRVSELREVSIEDLLGREPVSLDWDGIRAGLTSRTILVTGAGGSIGSELCRQIARLEPARLVLLEQGEFNLYSIEMELRHALPGLPLEVHLGDVGDAVAVAWLFARYRPQVVFHAAAYKHVPMLEHQVREAVRNNVLGTRVVAEAADRFGAAQFVLISTDKAVNPANVMGASKRVAELFCQNLNARSATRFITVRFGNVLGSAGSVVPLFRRQIERGGPVTVTHPEMTRYFMTIPEASQLIMQAAVLGAGGEIFVLDMGEPIKIRYLAEQMIRLAGRVPGDDVEIRYTGLRPGEKLFEELFHDQEALAGTAHDKILLARHRAVAWPELVATLDEMAVACARYDEAALSAALQRLVPELECTEEGQTPAQAN